MVRRVIEIDEEKCNGCGLCAKACHEGAIDMVNGKAKLMREHFCDGLGDCLPNCPTGAITFVTKEAPEYDEAAVKTAQAEKLAAEQKSEKPQEEIQKRLHALHQGGGCPGSKMRMMNREQSPAAPVSAQQSQLVNWPVQLKLAPVRAPYFDGSRLLIAADCTAYAYASFHQDFIRGRVALIGCPKLDSTDYSEKLTAIIRENNIKEVTIVRMEVPCCGGLQRMAQQAIQQSGKFIPWQVRVISIDGEIVE